MEQAQNVRKESIGGVSFGLRSIENDESTANFDRTSNFAHTYCRVNPFLFSTGSVFIEQELDELCLSKDAFEEVLENTVSLNYESFAIPGVLDAIYNQDSESEVPHFVSQEQVFIDLMGWLKARYSSGAGSLAILALGPASSGKSYTLFGNNNSRERGVLPRLISYLFDEKNEIFPFSVQISAMMVVEEEIYDLLEVINTFTFPTFRVD